ncbi:MAG: hypothetical protein SFV81_18440, partial [Pirellulaceae bacterium]|nr:hypothetical protein [Pirellulaceae bacterium]
FALGSLLLVNNSSSVCTGTASGTPGDSFDWKASCVSCARWVAIVEKYRKILSFDQNDPCYFRRVERKYQWQRRLDWMRQLAWLWQSIVRVCVTELRRVVSRR